MPWDGGAKGRSMGPDSDRWGTEKFCTETDDETCNEDNIITDYELNQTNNVLDLSGDWDGTTYYRHPQLFIPIGDKSVFNANFIRCPERVSIIVTNTGGAIRNTF